MLPGMRNVARVPAPGASAGRPAPPGDVPSSRRKPRELHGARYVEVDLTDPAQCTRVSSELPGALNKLSDGTYKSIDYNGAFGPLNFDAATGEPAANVQIFCLANDAGNAKSQLSGAFYNADTKMLENIGSIDTNCK